MNNNKFFSKQDVADAGWILETQDTLNHGLCNLIWAAKVIAWFQNFLQLIRDRVAVIRGRGITTSIKDIINQTAALVRNEVLSVEPIMYVA